MERLKLKVAVYLFLIKDEKILLSRRFKTGWQDGNYGLPSGHVEAGEGMVDALLRETKEETGVILKQEDVNLVHTMQRNNIYIDLFFTAKNWFGEPQIMEKEKCDDMQWFPLTNLPENMVPSVRFAIESYQKGITFSDFNREG